VDKMEICPPRIACATKSTPPSHLWNHGRYDVAQPSLAAVRRRG
jgi:hypothetical protein